MRQRSFLPTQRFAPYGAQSVVGVSSLGAPTTQSGVIHGISRPYVLTLAKYQARLSEQVSTMTIPSTAQVVQTSKSVQQTGAIAGHALHIAQQAKQGMEQLKH